MAINGSKCVRGGPHALEGYKRGSPKTDWERASKSVSLSVDTGIGPVTAVIGFESMSE